MNEVTVRTHMLIPALEASLDEPVFERFRNARLVFMIVNAKSPMARTNGSSGIRVQVCRGAGEPQQVDGIDATSTADAPVVRPAVHMVLLLTLLVSSVMRT